MYLRSRFGARTMLLAGGAVLIVAAILAGMQARPAAGTALFNAAGELIRPEGYREWVYVGTPLTPNDMNSDTIRRMASAVDRRRPAWVRKCSARSANSSASLNNIVPNSGSTSPATGCSAAMRRPLK